MVTSREQPTAPPSAAASASMGAKPSADPAPRPPLTTTLASASETPPPASVCVRSATRTTRSASVSAGVNSETAVCAGAAAGAASTTCGATVRSFVLPWTRACSSRLPPQRRRVTSAGSPGAASMQFAASGRSPIAAAWAIASVARSLPGAITATGACDSTSSAIARPHACGANAVSPSWTTR